MLGGLVSRERAVDAAVAVGRAQGVRCGEPVVLRDLTNVLVHLAPGPVVARVPVTLARLRDRAWNERVLDLAAFLSERGAPVAPPAADVDPGPHLHDGLLVELWAHVDHDPARFDPAAAGRALRELHGALEGYGGPLPRFDRLDEVGRLLARLKPSGRASPDDLSALQEAHARLSGEPVPPGRPLHGDSHFNNVLWSPEGPLWTDLENACSGRVEYDLAALTWRGRPETEAALAAYGPYEDAEVERVTPFLALFLAAWTIVVEARTPAPGASAELRRRIDWVRAWVEG
jgi:hypothetical protein